MEELRSKRNGLPIRRGVILAPGPNSKWAPQWCYQHVVTQTAEGFNVLSQHNNVGFLSNEEAQDYYVACGYSSREDWNWKDPEMAMGQILDDEQCSMSGICAGVEDTRFG